MDFNFDKVNKTFKYDGITYVAKEEPVENLSDNRCDKCEFRKITNGCPSDQMNMSCRLVMNELDFVYIDDNGRFPSYFVVLKPPTPEYKPTKPLTEDEKLLIGMLL